MIKELLKEVKDFLRVEQDYTEEDTFLSSLTQSAMVYIRNATGIDIDASNTLHRLAVLMLVTHWYEKREVVGEASALAYSLKSILMQIEYGSDEE